jgi:histidinol-phosphate aminotransferase
VLLRFPREGAHTAGNADAFLLSRGIALRPLAAYGLPHALRLTVGTEEANRAIVSALMEFMKR